MSATPPDDTVPQAAEAEGVRVDADHVIPRHEITVRATRAGGAGGQHVNKTATRVELYWSPSTSRALTPVERDRVAEKLRTRLDAAGLIRIVASDTRSQLQNRELAEGRLAELVRRALVVPKKRKATKPSRAAKEARLDEKKRRSTVKERRRKREWD